MTPAEAIYRVLLRLYPAEHRHAYGQSMLHHARDQEHVARQRGRRHLAALYLHLIGDGVVNAGIEHVEAIKTAESACKPISWPAVLMAVFPGLWLALSRRYPEQLTPVFSILGIGYLLLLLLIPPIMWRRARPFPVWALLPAGMLALGLIYRLIGSLSSEAGRLGIPDTQGVLILLLNCMLVLILFFTMLRGRRTPTSVWMLIALLLISGLLLVASNWQIFRWRGFGLPEFIVAALYAPAEALGLVALGLLAARRHNVLALLVVVGGYALMFGDTDTLWGYSSRDWAGIPLYLASMMFLFFVLAPVAFMRAKTRPGRAVALFVPALLFLAARLVIPALVLGQSATIRFGDAQISGTILLSLIIGWFLYSHVGAAEEKEQPGSAQALA